MKIRNKQVLNMLLIPIMLGINLVGMYLTYLLFWPLNIVELSSFEVKDSVVRKGEHAQFVLSFNKRLDYKPEVSWYLVDGTVIKLNEGSVRRPVGQQIYNREIFIPDSNNIPADRTYRLQADISYPILNGLRTVNYIWTSNEFTVVD